MYVMITLNTHTRNLRPLLFTLAAAHSFLNSNEVTENEVLRAVGWETDTIKTMCYVMWCYHIQLAHIILGEKMTSVRLADFMHKKLFVVAVPSGSPQNVAPLLWQKLLGGCHDNGQVQQSLMDNLVTDVEMGPKWAEIHQAQHHAAAQLWAASSVRFFLSLGAITIQMTTRLRWTLHSSHHVCLGRLDSWKLEALLPTYNALPKNSLKPQCWIISESGTLGMVNILYSYT